MKFRWRRRPAQDASAEAREVLERLAERDVQVARLHRELAERQRMNNFSRMVAVAISRCAERTGG